MRKEFERVTPEAVGISSAAILEYLDELEVSNTEMHALIIMRHGKICAEGSWSPYGMKMRHSLQSHSKTYAATAMGVAVTRGEVGLDERVIDIFPEYAPAEPSENLRLLTVRDVLCMGCGMDREPPRSENWIRDFLHMPVNHKPGTAYYYNSTGSSLLGAIIKKRTGYQLEEYLSKYFYPQAGIDPSNHRWYCMPDGTQAGGFGMLSTIEDNLRMMKVYADGGLCGNERVLDAEYVKLATTNQNDSASEAIGNPEATDNHVGYGFQIWMCKPRGVYRADGAMGQFTIVCPEQDMIIAITETAIGAHWAQSTLDITWRFLAKVQDDQRLTETADTQRLARRMQTLSVPKLPCKPESSLIPSLGDRKYRVAEGYLTPFFYNTLLMPQPPEGIREFHFVPDDYGLQWHIRYDSDREECIFLPTCGIWASQLLGREGDYLRICAASACWTEDHVLEAELKWTESCFTKKLRFTFSDEGLQVEDRSMKPVVAKAPDTHVRIELQ